MKEFWLGNWGIEGWGGLTIKTKDGGSTIDGGTVLYIPMGKYDI